MPDASIAVRDTDSVVDAAAANSPVDGAPFEVTATVDASAPDGATSLTCWTEPSSPVHEALLRCKDAAWAASNGLAVFTSVSVTVSQTGAVLAVTPEGFHAHDRPFDPSSPRWKAFVRCVETNVRPVRLPCTTTDGGHATLAVPLMLPELPWRTIDLGPAPQHGPHIACGNRSATCGTSDQALDEIAVDGVGAGDSPSSSGPGPLAECPGSIPVPCDCPHRANFGPCGGNLLPSVSTLQRNAGHLQGCCYELPTCCGSPNE